MAIQNISLIRMGALGILFGNFLTEKLGHDHVSFIADEERTADFLIFAVKANSLSSAVAYAQNYVGENTIILSLLNGITSESVIGETLGMKHMLYSVAQGMDALKLENNLTYTQMGEICVGIPESEPDKQPKPRAVADLFDSTGLPYIYEDDIIHRLWSKWMLNVGVNQVVMVNQGTYDTVQKKGPVRETMKAAMRKVIALAEYKDISVTEEDLVYYVNMIDSLNPNGMPSMRQDGISKKYSEAELFSGTVIREAEKYNLDVPVNRKLYREVKELERSY